MTSQALLRKIQRGEFTKMIESKLVIVGCGFSSGAAKTAANATVIDAQDSSIQRAVAPLVAAHTSKAGLVWPGWMRAIRDVLTARCNSQIAASVIQRITIEVVNIISRLCSDKQSMKENVRLTNSVFFRSAGNRVAITN